LTRPQVRPKPDTTSGTADETGGVHVVADPHSGLQPWQFFVLAALGCATALTFLVRGQGVATVVLVSVLMGASALVGLAALRAVRPLVAVQDDRTVVIGERTRATLERDKALTLRAIKDMEFDRAMGKVSDQDFAEMTGRLRARAVRIMKQLDAGAGYRMQIERDLAKRLGATDKAPARETRACVSCATENDPDAKFCKNCGAKL
jgi:parvulin-like peptidyl-prolyl isomerase